MYRKFMYVCTVYSKFIISITFQKTSVTAVGTMAYVIDEEALLVRVNRGWQYISVRLHLPPGGGD